MTEPLLQAVGLSCERDDRLLFSGLSFAIRPGTVTRVEGPNGAGKTTLLRIMAGLFQGYEGELTWLGEPLAYVREHFQRNLLYLGHRPGVKPLLTPVENLRVLTACRRQVADDALEAALQQVGLEDYLDVPCHQLSAGQHRRVALARLYLSDEPLWLLDEAFTAIDRDGVLQIEQLLARRAEAGGAVVLTTHHTPDIANLAQLHLQGAA